MSTLLWRQARWTPPSWPGLGTLRKCSRMTRVGGTTWLLRAVAFCFGLTLFGIENFIPEYISCIVRCCHDGCWRATSGEEWGWRGCGCSGIVTTVVKGGLFRQSAVPAVRVMPHLTPSEANIHTSAITQQNHQCQNFELVGKLMKYLHYLWTIF